MKHTALIALVVLILVACTGADDATEGTSRPGAALAADLPAPSAADESTRSEPSRPIRAAYEAGVHYERLGSPRPAGASTGRVEVAEAFWYGCSHCKDFDPYIERWRLDKARDVSFVRVPATWSPAARMHARAYYTAEALGKLDAMHAAFFTEMHVNGNALDTEAKLAELFAEFGVDGAAFKTVFDSPDVDSKVQHAAELYAAYQFRRVPAVVVAGTYKTDASMAGDYDTLIDVIETLVGE